MFRFNAAVRYFTVGAILATIAGWDRAQAGLQSVVQDGVFATTDQALTGPGGQLGFTSSNFLGVEWGQQQYSFDYGLLGNDAFGVLLLDPGRVGLKLDTNLTLGSVGVKYPVKLTFELPEEVLPGESFQISTAWAKNPNPELKTIELQASATLSLVLNLKASAGAGFSTLLGDAVYTADQPGDPNSFSSPVPQGLIDAHARDITLVDTGGDVSLTLLSVGPSGANFNVPLGGPFSLTYQHPKLDLSANGYTGDSIVASDHSKPPFISANMDLVSVAVYAANALGQPIPQLSGSVEISDVVEITWTGLAVNVQAGPSLYQSVAFTPTGFPITLTTTDGQTATGLLGDDFTFVAPNQRGVFDIHATVDIDNLFTNSEGLLFAVNLNTQALGGSMRVGGFDLFSFGPLINLNTPLYTSDPWLPFPPAQFPLQGFNSLEQPLAVMVVPEASSLLLAGLCGGALLFGRWTRRRRA
jgi:hypothetical protein